MSKCNFCTTDVKEWDKKQVGYLVASTNENGDGEYHTHVHGTMADKNVAEDLIDAQIKETGLTDLFKQKFGQKAIPSEIIFHNRQRIGDMLMFTCGIRDFKKAYPNVKVNVLSTCGHMWDHNPNVDRSLQPTYKDGVTLETAKPIDLLEGRTNVLKIGPSKLTNSSNRLDWHFANAFRVSIEDNLGITIPQGESRPDIYITQEEYDAPRITERPYWIIVTGGEKGWGCKMYPDVRWQEVIDQNPDILFYQIGSKGDNHLRLKGPNVVDYVGKTEDRETGIRDLFKLFLNAEGSIGLVSFHMHLSGALKKPCVVVAGAREPVSFTRYAGHQYIANDGCLPCATTACWHCDIKACTNPVVINGETIPKCVDMISSSDVTSYLRRYYIGGRLDLNKPSEKPRGLNIVNTPKKDAPKPKVVWNTYGLEFGGGALTELDWEFISDAINKYGVRSVLEFGAGLSTLLLNDKLANVVTYEDKQGWIDKLKKLKPGINIQLWNGKDFSNDEQFDMAFVDGPAGDSGREISTKIASEKCRLVVVHDAGREWARKYQDLYIKDSFDGPIKGGHRCHLWVKKNKNITVIPTVNDNKNVTVIPTVNKVDKKVIKFVSTARGWGGCARSITTMMKMLLKDGHDVEFIPFRGAVSSREFQECIKTDLAGLKVTTNYETINEKCDVFFMYCDDFIWEFDNGDIVEAFSNINATKKIMAINYRRGKVGQTEWTKGWDKYLFLNSEQELSLKNIHPGAVTKILSPCTDLSSFFKATPSFENGVRIVRHNSQGDTKFPKDFAEEVATVLTSRPDVTMRMMPGPSFVEQTDRFVKVGKNTETIPDFLGTGNLFWYSLPKDYVDAGPRVILEAMAAGLPVIADNWGGAVDRITPECGWLCRTKKEMADIIKNVTLDELKSKGEAARKRAKEGFVAERWIGEIVGD